MKERVLEYLNSLANEKDNDGILLWLVGETRLIEVEIYKRAGIIHKHILHNYADLGISTIDKFTYKIVRTFASDFGLSHNFDASTKLSGLTQINSEQVATNAMAEVPASVSVENNDQKQPQRRKQTKTKFYDSFSK